MRLYEVSNAIESLKSAQKRRQDLTRDEAHWRKAGKPASVSDVVTGHGSSVFSSLVSNARFEIANAVAQSIPGLIESAVRSAGAAEIKCLEKLAIAATELAAEIWSKELPDLRNRIAARVAEIEAGDAKAATDLSEGGES